MFRLYIDRPAEEKQTKDRWKNNTISSSKSSIGGLDDSSCVIAVVQLGLVISGPRIYHRQHHPQFDASPSYSYCLPSVSAVFSS